MMGVNEKQTELWAEPVKLPRRVQGVHILRKLHKTMDLSFVRHEVAPFYGGNASVDSVIIMKMMPLLFLDNVKSFHLCKRQGLTLILGAGNLMRQPIDTGSARIIEKNQIEKFKETMMRTFLIGRLLILWMLLVCLMASCSMRNGGVARTENGGKIERLVHEETFIWFRSDFSGEKVILRVDGKTVFSGKMKTDYSIILADSFAIRPSTSLSRVDVYIPSFSIEKSFNVNWEKGKYFSFFLKEGELTTMQEEETSFMY